MGKCHKVTGNIVEGYVPVDGWSTMVADTDLTIGDCATCKVRNVLYTMVFYKKDEPVVELGLDCAFCVAKFVGNDGYEPCNKHEQLKREDYPGCAPSALRRDRVYHKQNTYQSKGKGAHKTAHPIQ